jgi:uncharacterized protein (TIGR03382 family)
VTTPLAVGAHQVDAIAHGPGGPSPSATPVHFMTADLPPPATPVILDPADGSTVSTTPLIRGTTDVGTTVEIHLDAATLATVGPSQDGTFSFQVTTPLAVGTHQLGVIARTAQGAFATAVAIFMAADLPPPSAPVILDPADGSTVSTTPLIRGTTDVGTTVDILVDMVPVATVGPSQDGTFSFHGATPLSIGMHMLDVIARTAQGRSASSHAVFTAANLPPPSAPVILEPADGSTVSRTPLIHGTTDVGTTVDIILDLQLLATVGPSQDGTFIASTSAGTFATAAAVMFMAADLAPPTTPTILEPADGSTVSTTPLIRGTTDVGTTVDILLDMVPLATVGPSQDGTFSFQVTTPLSVGMHRLDVIARTAQGTSASSGAVFTAANLPPPSAPVILEPTDGSTVSATPVIRGTTDVGTTVEILLDMVTLATVGPSQDGTFTLQVAMPLSAGMHQLDAVARTAQGTFAASAQVVFTVSTTAPPAPPVFLEPTDGSTVMTTTPLIRGTTEVGTTVDLVLDSAPLATVGPSQDGTFSFQVTTPLSIGPHQLTGIANGPGGAGANGTTIVFTVATAPGPSAPVITFPTDGATVLTAQPTILGTAEPLVTVQAFVDGALAGETTADQGAAFSIALSQPLAAGSHTLFAVAVNANGPSAPSAQVVFLVSLGPSPAPPQIDSPHDGFPYLDLPPIRGQAPGAAQVALFLDGASLIELPVDANGAFGGTFPPGVFVAEGNHRLTAVPVNAAGQIGANGTSITFYLVVGQLGTGGAPGPKREVAGGGCSAAGSSPALPTMLLLVAALAALAARRRS